MNADVKPSLLKLASIFKTYDWTYHDVSGTNGKEKTWHWLGKPDEEVIICVYKGNELNENFHRQDFFYFNYAYKGSFDALCRERSNRVTVTEGELCAGQPFTGYALKCNSDKEIVIVGVLVKQDLFFRTLLPLLSSNARLLHFFLDPEDDVFSNRFLHLTHNPRFPYRTLIDLMIVEYANQRKSTQEILRSLVLSLTTYALIHYEDENPQELGDGTMSDIIDYLASNLEHATLGSTAEAFSYHSNYLSSLIKKETGKTFTQILLEHRMKRARLLLNETTLSIEEITSIVGYSSTSNFYKVFREYFGHSPRSKEL